MFFSETAFKNSLLQRPPGRLSGHAASCTEHAQTGFTLSEHAQKDLVDGFTFEEEGKNGMMGKKKCDPRENQPEQTELQLHFDNLNRSEREEDEKERERERGTREKRAMDTLLCGL